MPPTMIRKNFGHTVSVMKGSNKITACSKVDWGPVKTGSIIALEGDQDFYKITEKDKSSYYNETEVLNSNQLKINGHTGESLSVNDSIVFANNEYEIYSVNINKAGEGYQNSDELSLTGGVLKYNSSDEIDLPVRLKVESVDDNGGVKEVSIIFGGEYNVPPEADAKPKGGNGTGLTLSFAKKLKEKRTTEQRTIADIEYKEDHTVLYLNHTLPPRVHSGSISTTKWEILISREYAGESKYDVGYEIYKDFTPNLNIPIIRGNMAANSMLYNEGMLILDQKIKELEEKINAL